MIEALSVVAIQSILLVMIGGAIANKMTGGALFEGLRMTLDFLQEPATWYIAVVNVFVALYSIITNPLALAKVLGSILANIASGGISGIFQNIFDAIDTVTKAAMGLGKIFASKRATKTQMATVFALTLSRIIATLAIGVIIGLVIAGVMKYIVPVIGRMISRIATKFRAVRSSGIYEFKGASGQMYVGKASTLWRRLFWNQTINGKRVWGHLWTGKLKLRNIRTVRFKKVVGSATKLRVAEQQRMLFHGGKEVLENSINALAPKYWNKLNWKRYQVPGIDATW